MQENNGGKLSGGGVRLQGNLKAGRKELAGFCTRYGVLKVEGQV